MKVEIGDYNSGEEKLVKVCIEDFDTWNMDETLAYIILPMLKQLRETKHGSPFVDDEDVPDLPRQTFSSNESMQLDLFASNEHDEQVWDLYEVRWNYVLDEMIWAFEQIVEDSWIEDFYTSSPTKMDFEGMRKHEEKMKRGLRLFGKYYLNLWD